MHLYPINNKYYYKFVKRYLVCTKIHRFGWLIRKPIRIFLSYNATMNGVGTEMLNCYLLIYCQHSVINVPLQLFITRIVEHGLGGKNEYKNTRKKTNFTSLLSLCLIVNAKSFHQYNI